MKKVIALIAISLFYGCYFMKMYAQRRKSITTDQMGKGKIGFVKFVETGLKIISISVPAAEILCILLLPGSGYQLFLPGAVIAFCGDAVFIASVLTMKDNWRAGVPETDKTELVTAGIYQISRNPAFLGFDLNYLGCLLMYPNVWLFALSAAAALMFHLQIVNVEEPFLQASFGEEYLTYAKKVGRYLGRK